MSLALTIKIAWKNMIGNRLRSALTILGLVIGIASVILLVGLVNGATQNVNEEMSTLGADMAQVYIFDSDNALTYEELREIGKLDMVAGVTPKVDIYDATLSKNGKKATGAELIGGGESYAAMMGLEMAQGRDMSRIDVDNYTKCAVIGSNIAGQFWKQSQPCGDTIKIDGDDYTVVGVLKSAGAAMGDNVDGMVIIPLSTAGYLGQDTSIMNFYVRAEDKDHTKEVGDEVKSYLQTSKDLGKDDCEVMTQQQMMEAIDEINRTMALLLGGIASISLLVGGIGVMNVMLVSVTERTKEIGIRKSLGARRRDIMFQFLVESVVLSLAGGIIGVLAGMGCGRIAMLVGGYFAPGLGIILLAFGVSMAVGLIFGILPAHRAAKLRPVEALRYE